MSEPIYLNNAATTWPKPECVYKAVDDALRHVGSPRRSSIQADTAADVMELGRQHLARFLNAPDPTRMLLMAGCTHALSMAILGREWQAGDVMIVSGLEHHGVNRPARRLRREVGIDLRVAPYEPENPFDLDWLEEQLKPGGVKMVCSTAASNVTGQVLPFKEITRLAHRYGALALVDGAQAAGVLPIDIADIGCDFFSFAGHKGLFGPPGVGGMYVGADAPVMPLVEGGTAADSGALDLTYSFPYAYEAGTVNHPAMAGLYAGVKWLEETGPENVRARETEHVNRLIAGLDNVPNLTRYGPAKCSLRTGAVSFNIDGVECHDLAAVLCADAGIIGRAGFHCSPLAHMTIGSHPLGGALRLSPGYFTTDAEIDRAIEAISAVATAAKV